MPTTNNFHQEVLTEEIQEVISYRPHWIVRNGNTIFLIFLLGVICLTWIIRYPDVVKSSARLVALNPPKQIVARVQGKLVKLSVKDNDKVQAGQPLGYLESTADYTQVNLLAEYLDKQLQVINTGNIKAAASIECPFFKSLGELQTVYQQFQNQLAITKQTFQSGYYEQKRNALQQDMHYLTNLKNHVQQQLVYQEEDRALQEKEYKAYEQLEKEKVIAPLELNQYKSKLLSKDQSLDQLGAQVTTSDIGSLSKYKELLDLQKQVTDQHQQFRSSLLQLKSEVERWIQQYVLVAAESGQVIFASTLTENQFISAGQPVFYIQPGNSTYYLELLAGQKGFGKIKERQRVIVKVDGYPSEEFGTLTASINYVSLIPNRTDSFALRADLTNGLRTSYGKEIFFNNSLTAQADIITEERRLIHRFMGQLKKIWER